MAINEFFNTSSFTIVTVEKEPAIQPDTFFTIHMYIYDTLSLLSAETISAKYYLKSGRTKTYLNTNAFTLKAIGSKTWSLDGQVTSSDWNDNQSFGMEATISFTTPQGFSSSVFVDKIIVGD